MKRRSFLGLIGAAIATPAFPAAAPPVPGKIAGLATAHAHKYPFVSATGLSKRLGVPIKEAQQLLIDLSRKGLVGQVHTCGTGPIHAASKVFKPTTEGMVRAAQARQAARQVRADRLARAQHAAQQMQVDLSRLIQHLHGICTGNGVALRPRALECAT